MLTPELQKVKLSLIDRTARRIKKGGILIIEFRCFTLKTLILCTLKGLNRQSHVRYHQQNPGLVQVAVLERR